LDMVASFQAIQSNRGLCQAVNVGAVMDEFAWGKFM
jgi:hypothetical protein